MTNLFIFWVVVQSLSYVWLFATSWAAARQASLSFTISRSLLKLMSVESVMPSNHLILYHAFLLLPSIFPSIRIFSSELALWIRWPKYWNFSFSIIPSKEIPGLISFRSILQHSAFIMVQLSHLYITTGKTIALIIWTFIRTIFELNLFKWIIYLNH